jgi:hypothetical protein
LFGTTEGGAITSKTEATTEGYHYELYKTRLIQCVPVNGETTIIENGTYDISDSASVVVNVPNAVVMGIWVFNDTINIYPFPFGKQDVTFTTGFYNNDKYFSMGFELNNSVPTLRYNKAYGGSAPYDTESGWSTETSKTVDFGAEPQIVKSAFKEWLVANATPTYTVTITRTE